MENCIFCKIVAGEAPSFKIYEDEKYIAILDKYPNIKGQTLVITKEHVDSYAFDLSDDELCNLINTAKKVAKLLEKGLGVERVHMVLEGAEISHLHAKLYPAIGIAKHEKSVAKGTVSFERYEGYISTMHGPQASDEELEKLKNMIVEKNKQ